ncbi:vitellogenin-2-like isoform 1-T2 [Cochliomyia hominivorax]
MNCLRIVCLLVGIFAVVNANRGPTPWSPHNNRNSVKNALKPTDWLSVSELENLPTLNAVTISKLEEMSVQEGAELLNKMYHLTQAGQAIEPTYVPKPSDIPCFLITPDNKKVSFKLNELPKVAQEQKDFGDEEVTIYITGLPQKSDTIKKATSKLVKAYMQRYNSPAPPRASVKYEDYNESPTSSEEDYSSTPNTPSGNLVVIGLGEVFRSMQQYASLDVENTGVEIADVLVKCIDKADVPHEIVHLIGSNIGAHVAGAVGRHFTAETGHQFRRITGLDPSKIYAQPKESLRGLARGDAEFVDVIHTSAYGLGTPTRCGDVDFYPNGPSEGVPGADNVVEASMRAVRYFAESVVPGNERNFPAVGATSLKQYKEQNGNGKRVYMGISTEYDVEGDFMLQVNSKSPFGRATPATKQQNYHNVHKPWRTSSKDY